MNNEEPLKSVSIYLRGNELNPEHISEVLGIQPTLAHKKGRFKTKSKKYVAKIGIWAVNVKSESRSVSDLIDEIFDKIGDPPTKLDQVQGVEDAHLDILFAFGDEMKHTVVCVLNKNQMARASQLGLSLCVTVM